MKVVHQAILIRQFTGVAFACAIVSACGGGDGEWTQAGPAPASPAPEVPLLQHPADNNLAASTATVFPAPDSTATPYAKLLNNATANAGTDPFFATVLRRQWCFTAENAGRPPELADTAVVPITKIFDNVYYTGLRTVGQYIFKTSLGLFLIDTLNNTSEVQTITEPQLAAVGLSATSIRAAMPTHGHGDHHGGAAYLQSTYGIPIYLGSGDQASKPFTVTPLDSTNLEPQAMTLGGQPITLLSTPGHTPGTFSGVLPVTHQGKPYKIAFWGGTGMPTTIPSALQYQDGTERLYRLAAKEGADGTIHTHPFVDGSLNHVDEIRASGLGDRNPFLLGKDETLRSLAVLRSCAAAKVAQLDATAQPSQWLVTTIEAASTFVRNQAKDNLSASARVQSPYGAIENVEVAFTFTETGESCKAKTDARGIATCTISSTAVQPGAVTAAFGGNDMAQPMVYLPSSSTVQATAIN